MNSVLETRPGFSPTCRERVCPALKAQHIIEWPGPRWRSARFSGRLLGVVSGPRSLTVWTAGLPTMTLYFWKDQFSKIIS